MGRRRRRSQGQGVQLCEYFVLFLKAHLSKSVIFVHYTKLLAFVLALPNLFFFFCSCKLSAFISNAYFKRTVETFFFLSASIPWVLDLN